MIRDIDWSAGGGRSDPRQGNISPTIRVAVIGANNQIDILFQAINDFRLGCSVLDIYDGFSFSVPMPDKVTVRDIGRALEIDPRTRQPTWHATDLCRWWPCKIWHADPQVQNGRERPMMTGVITSVNISGPPTVLKVEGFDLGKLLDSCGPTWRRIKDGRMKSILDLVLDRTWLAANRSDDWGIRGVVGEDINKRIKTSRFRATQGYYAKIEQVMPPLQVEVGEAAYDILARYARMMGQSDDPLGGQFVNVSADGYLQIFNPSDADDDEPLYVLNHRSGDNNQRIKSYSLDGKGDGLYSEYRCYSSIIVPDRVQDVTDPNRGKIYGVISNTNMGGKSTLNRLNTFADGEQYTTKRCQARTEWMQKRREWEAWALTYVVQGHSMPGPDGKWHPLAEGNICEVRDEFLNIEGRFYLEKVDFAQDSTGTTSTLRLRKRGLLAA